MTKLSQVVARMAAVATQTKTEELKSLREKLARAKDKAHGKDREDFPTLYDQIDYLHEQIKKVQDRPAK
jgi:DNA mismatch repair ATPase MutS